MKRILIALDYNPTAQKVADVGFSMAKAMGAEVVLLHVMGDLVYYASPEYSPITGFSGYMDMGPIQLDSVEGLRKASQHYLDIIKRHLGDANIKTMVTEGEVAGAIMKTAGELDADIIVMGSHSRKWLENIIMGSATETVFHHTEVPLFIVPTKQHG